MDWAHVLIWIICIATGLNAAILLWTRAGLRHAKSWLLLQLLIFGGTLGGSLWDPQSAALGGGIAWFVLVLAPSLLLRLLYRLSAKRRYTMAIRVADVLRWLWVHSADGLIAQRELLSILRQISLGEEAPALERLEKIASEEGPLQQTARYFTFYLRGHWTGLLDWIQQEFQDEVSAGQEVESANADEPPESETGSLASASSDEADAGVASREWVPDGAEPGVTQLFWMIRSLAETGQLEAAIDVYMKHEATLLQQGELLFELWAVLMAFAGRVAVIRELLQGPLHRWAPQSQSLLLATVELASGDEAAGKQRLRGLQESGDPIIQQRASSRLAQADMPARCARELPGHQRAHLDQLTETMMRELRYAGKQSLHRKPWLTWSISLSLFVVFAVLEWRGGSTNSRVLIEMGAMIPTLVLAKGEYWRLCSFPMLHYGAVHLLLNVMALLLFGPFVERTLGSVRFLLLYLFAGIGGGALICLAAHYDLMPELRMAAYVGASGAIFGLIGATLAIMLKGWLREKVMLAKRRIIWLMLIIGLQTAFDLNTPKVSLGAHWSGLLLGFLIALILWSPKRSQSLDPKSS